MSEPLFAGVEIGGTKLQLITGSARGEILQRKRFHVDKSSGGEGIRQIIRAELPLLLNGISRIGVGFGGPVDISTGTICCSHQILGWNNFNLTQWFAEFTPLPVVIDNDANVATLGEAIFGAGKSYNPVFYVTLGSGVGGGLVVNKKIYHGAKPGESEIGHLRLDRSGAILEEHCSGWAVDKAVRAFAAQNPNSSLAGHAQNFPFAEAKALVPALAQADPDAQAIISATAANLALGLSHVTHLFHPQAIILGGGLSLIGTPLLDNVQNYLNYFTMEAFKPGASVLLANLKEDAVPAGCLALASA